MKLECQATLDTNNSTCLILTGPDTTDAKCLFCRSGYVFNDNNECIVEPIPTSCEDGAHSMVGYKKSVCSCKTNEYYNSVYNRCFDGSLKNCEQATTQGMKEDGKCVGRPSCQQCKSGFIKNPFGQGCVSEDECSSSDFMMVDGVLENKKCKCTSPDYKFDYNFEKCVSALKCNGEETPSECDFTTEVLTFNR
jgi:hypothetical protein